ncbi:MAG: YaaL family protein [Alicyclobacillus sp.]|nr:YaaL family protein [Alicyclobacillus sp.]
MLHRDRPAKAAGGDRSRIPVVASAADADVLIQELRRSKRELEQARQQFNLATDPLLVDHAVFRLGAAERQFNYLFQLARRYQVRVEGMRWEWWEDD